MLANRRLSGIVTRHRNKLPEIPMPPRLSVLLKCMAFLAVVTLLLVPVGLSYANIATQMRLRAAGLVPASFHNATQGNISVPCTTTCDSQLHCHAECAFHYTLLDESKGTITKRNCSNTGLLSTNASIATHVGWKCSFDYVVNEAEVDSDLQESLRFEWGVVKWLSVFIAVHAVAGIELLLQVDRTIGDAFVAATESPRRDMLRRKHENLRRHVIDATIIAFISAGLFSSAALYGTTFQSFWAVDIWFFFLLLSSFAISFLVFTWSCGFLYDQR